jgi:hypothetical protein
MMNRNYDEFVEDFTEALSAEMPDKEIKRVAMPKANSTMDALTIREPGAMAAPVVYLQDVYDSGMTAHECAEAVASAYGTRPVPEFKEENLFKNPENHLYACVVSKETNGKLLETSPHREIPGTDLCMLARYRIDDNSSYLINNSNFSYLGFDNPDEVMDMAISNTEREEFHCQGLGSVLADMIGSDDEECMEMAAQAEKSGDGLYVVTNERMTDGAVVLGLPGKMKEMVEATGEEKAYVLPSSRHEILLLPESFGKEMSVDGLENMIHEVNATTVAEQDVLSQRAYFWNGKSLCMAKDLEKAMPEKTAEIVPMMNAGRERAKVSAQAR